MTEIIFKILGILLAIFSFLPFFSSKHWFFRIFDFLRIQLAALLIVTLGIASLFISFTSIIDLFVILFIIAGICCNLIIIIPYISFNKNIQPAEKQSEIVVLSVNVKQENCNYKHLIQLAQKIQPDILLTIETNKDWENNLKEIESNFKTVIRAPKENRYGMHLYSKLDIQEYKINYLIANEYPSIKAKMRFNNFSFDFWGIHPPPPSPTEKTTSKQKDAELMKLAKIISESENQTIVAGDFNNVTWSKTSKLFGKISNLKDARKKRGIHPTFPANYPLFRFPIDLIFHSNGIQIGHMKTVQLIGSDHLPLHFSFTIHSETKKKNNVDSEVENLADKTIQQGKKAVIFEN